VLNQILLECSSIRTFIDCSSIRTIRYRYW